MNAEPNAELPPNHNRGRKLPLNDDLLPVNIFPLDDFELALSKDELDHVARSAHTSTILRLALFRLPL
jgi:hypothetical protein